jgi:putative addiction module component (TIGR02574 family)
MSIDTTELRQLSIAERLQVVEDLWDSIAADVAANREALPVPETQRAEILRRSEAHRLNPSEAIPLDEVLDRIERSLG